MKNLINSVTLIGHLGNEPTIKRFNNGSQKAVLILATDESYQKKDGKRIIAKQWHTLIVTDALVDVVEKYLRKGMKISINGRLKNKRWINAAGKAKYRTEVEVSQLMMLSQMIA